MWYFIEYSTEFTIGYSIGYSTAFFLGSSTSYCAWFSTEYPMVITTECSTGYTTGYSREYSIGHFKVYITEYYALSITLHFILLSILQSIFQVLLHRRNFNRTLYKVCYRVFYGTLYSAFNIVCHTQISALHPPLTTLLFYRVYSSPKQLQLPQKSDFACCSWGFLCCPRTFSLSQVKLSLSYANAVTVCCHCLLPLLSLPLAALHLTCIRHVGSALI